MPTGYTVNLMRNGQSFPEFVMGCARAFGALVQMRDDPSDAPIPEKFDPTDYHSKELEKAQKELTRLQTMNDEEKANFGQTEKDVNIKRSEEYLEKSRVENKRLEDMEAQVRLWEPPTPDHQGMKDFMLNQLSISKNKTKHSEASLAEAKEKTAIAYYDDAVSSAVHDIEYHVKQNAKEVVSADDRTKWVRQLRASI